MFRKIHNSNNFYEIINVFYTRINKVALDKALSWQARDPVFEPRVELFFSLFFSLRFPVSMLMFMR